MLAVSQIAFKKNYNSTNLNSNPQKANVSFGMDVNHLEHDIKPLLCVAERCTINGGNDWAKVMKLNDEVFALLTKLAQQRDRFCAFLDSKSVNSGKVRLTVQECSGGWRSIHMEQDVADLQIKGPVDWLTTRVMQPLKSFSDITPEIFEAICSGEQRTIEAAGDKSISLWEMG